jgi:hypothetical protein
MADNKRPPTHGAYALRRESRLRSRWIEIGHASVAPGGTTVHHVFLDRLPIGGFTGHIYLSPTGVKPPDPEPQPERPKSHADEDDGV